MTTTGLVQGPKWKCWASLIERYCFAYGIDLLNIRSVPCGSDWLDSLLGTAREDVYFDVRGDLRSLEQMKNWLRAEVEKSKRKIS
jgi:hypothetical protein